MAGVKHDAGFALVEAVVALAIVAAILGAALQVMSRTQAMSADLETRREAMLQARSIVARLGATLPLVAGSSEGRAGAWQWRLDITPVADRELSAPLQHAVVTITDDRQRTLARLETLRLAR